MADNHNLTGIPPQNAFDNFLEIDDQLHMLSIHPDIVARVFVQGQLALILRLPPVHDIIHEARRTIMSSTDQVKCFPTKMEQNSSGTAFTIRRQQDDKQTFAELQQHSSQCEHEYDKLLRTDVSGT